MGVAHPEIAVDARESAEAIVKLAVGEDRPDERLGVEVVPHSTDKRLRGSTETRIEGIFELEAGGLIVGV